MCKKKVQRAFIDNSGNFAIIRIKDNKKWFQLRIIEGEVCLTDFKPKSESWCSFFGIARLHIHNNWLYMGSKPFKAFRVSGPGLDIETIVGIMNVKKDEAEKERENFDIAIQDTVDTIAELCSIPPRTAHKTGHKK